MTLWYGVRPVPLEDALRVLGTHGHHGAIDPVEGVVYRCERDGKVEFLAKWVRSDFPTGCHLPDISGCPEVWNWPRAASPPETPPAPNERTDKTDG